MKSEKKEWLDAWRPTPGANKEYDFIDGLRGIAILLVIACHFLYVNPNSNAGVRFMGGVFEAGKFGVTLFFTLSGFLISWPFWKRKVKGLVDVVPPGYAWRRFYRIYPPLAISVLLLTPVFIFLKGDWIYLKTAAQWLLGLPVFGAISESLFGPVSGKLNPVMWSLIVEVQFYILLPFLFIALKKVSAKTALWALTLGFILVPVLVDYWNFTQGIVFKLYPHMVIPFPTRLDAFAFGILLAGLQSMGSLPKKAARLGDLGMVLFIASLLIFSWMKLYGIHGHWHFFSLEWLVKIAAGCMLCYVADPQHPRARMLTQPWLCWCGIISYEWYLFHQPIILETRKFFGSSEGSALKYGAIVGGSLAAGLIITVLIYRLVSLPILQRGRSKHPTVPKVPEGSTLA